MHDERGSLDSRQRIVSAFPSMIVLVAADLRGRRAIAGKLP
jgi:hypothetical protein